jgi:hypothetical protein
MDSLRCAEQGTVDEQLAYAAQRAQVVHVLKVCQAWQGDRPPDCPARSRGRATDVLTPVGDDELRAA